MPWSVSDKCLGEGVSDKCLGEGAGAGGALGGRRSGGVKE